jgi:exodeoxyribonuclease V
MQFSPQQERALDAVSRWMKRGPQVFKLFGYAGTGKTTLAKHFAAGVNGSVQYGAFTGKAAMVMRKNGCAGASTIHSLMYTPDEDAGDDDGNNPQFKLNRNSKLAKAKLVIIDECSMVDETLGQDLLSFGVKILVLGDPGQLPPINGTGFFSSNPDALLEEIHRQAADNPIIRIATDAREGRPIPYGDYGAVKVIGRSALNADIVIGADQVLVGKNNTRRKFNGRIRELLGYKSQLPVAGDRLVALQNEKDRGILNGGLWTVKQLTGAGRGKNAGDFVNMLVSSMDFDDADPVKVKVKKDFFTNAAFKPNYRDLKGTQQFDYGYALTVHKSQGSQWSNVCVFDESRAFGDQQSRHLYTSVTRAAETLTIVR